jgi:hypothetical protein
VSFADLIFPARLGCHPTFSPAWVRTEPAEPGFSTNCSDDNMRATMRLHALTRRAVSGTIPTNRSDNVAFIGLGRMGYEMATNLWKKKFAGNRSGELIVCDSRQEVAMRFVEEANGRSASFVKTPRECVGRRCIVADLSDRASFVF